MKSKKTRKTKGGHIKAKHRTKGKAHRQSRVRAPKIASAETLSAPVIPQNITVRPCQEVEVGDIGGFGSTEELESHEKRCNEPATEFCANCGKNVCMNHYNLIHRDHDSAGHTPSQTPAQ